MYTRTQNFLLSSSHQGRHSGGGGHWGLGVNNHITSTIHPHKNYRHICHFLCNGNVCGNFFFRKNTLFCIFLQYQTTVPTLPIPKSLHFWNCGSPKWWQQIYFRPEPIRLLYVYATCLLEHVIFRAIVCKLWAHITAFLHLMYVVFWKCRYLYQPSSLSSSAFTQFYCKVLASCEIFWLRVGRAYTRANFYSSLRVCHFFTHARCLLLLIWSLSTICIPMGGKNTLYMHI